MRLWIRLAVLALAMAAAAMGVVHLRTETSSAGNRLHALYSRKRRLEKRCWRLHLAVARAKRVERLRADAAALKEPWPDPPHLGPPAEAPFELVERLGLREAGP